MPPPWASHTVAAAVRLTVLSRSLSVPSTARLVAAARARGHTVRVLDPVQVEMHLDGTRGQLLYRRRKLALPDVVFESAMTITLGNRTARVMYLGAGQNPGDTVVHFPHARALFIGGPFARKNWSNTSFTPSVDGWIALLNKLAALDVELYLPGHGDVGNRQDLLDEAKWLGDFQAGVRGAMAQGMSKEEMVQKLHFREYQHLRNYPLIHNFIEALHHLYTTGKPDIAMPGSP